MRNDVKRHVDFPENQLSRIHLASTRPHDHAYEFFIQELTKTQASGHACFLRTIRKSRDANHGVERRCRDV